MLSSQILHPAPVISAESRPANQREVYNAKWLKARNLLSAQARGKFLDCRERRLTARFVLRQASSIQQVTGGVV